MYFLLYREQKYLLMAHSIWTKKRRKIFIESLFFLVNVLPLFI